MPVVSFSEPVILDRGHLDRAKAQLSGAAAPVIDPSFGKVEGSAWLANLLSQDPDDLPTLEEYPPAETGTLREDGTALNLLQHRPGDVVLPAHVREVSVAFESDGAWAVIMRQIAELGAPDRRFHVRVPANCLKTEPQPVQIETRGDDNAISRREFTFHVPPSGLKPWMLSAFLNRGGAGNPMIRAFARGVGCRIAFAEDEPDELRDIPVVWGVLRGSDRILARAKAEGLYFFYIDHAYFNRGHGKTYRITRNGYEAGAVRNCPDDRVAALGADVQPWRMRGREIIVCPPTDFFMQAHGCPRWVDDTLDTLRHVTDRPIIVRSKPQPGEQAVPLAQALETAHALVTHSSNVAIEAACLGTPVFVAPASAAAPVGLTDLSLVESPVYPDRDQWLAHLSYSQFSFDEIRDGSAWRMLLEAEERELV